MTLVFDASMSRSSNRPAIMWELGGFQGYPSVLTLGGSFCSGHEQLHLTPWVRSPSKTQSSTISAMAAPFGAISYIAVTYGRRVSLPECICSTTSSKSPESTVLDARRRATSSRPTTVVVVQVAVTPAGLCSARSFHASVSERNHGAPRTRVSRPV